jgi:HKD family nuclease
MTISTRLLLGPDNAKQNELRDAYGLALDQAEELYIASAYLTEWDTDYKLGNACKSLVFLVGTDFNLTRKKAMRNVLRWKPKHITFSFIAISAPSGNFHPKIVAWKTSNGSCHCIVGSSNLSKAAFYRNYEANVMLKISLTDYKGIRKWLNDIAGDPSSSPIDEDWIEHHYEEAKIKPKSKSKSKAGVLKIAPSDLPNGPSCASAVRKRRVKEASFQEIAKPLRSAVSRCAAQKMTDSAFWRAFWGLWSKHQSRIQGSGLQFSGKKAKWHQACSALLAIMESVKSVSPFQLDQLVAKQIDQLHKRKNPMRGAWLSEMLCHYLPDLYPVRNKPVLLWLSKIQLRNRRGASEGEKYVELAQKLRLAVQKECPAGARNLPELDAAIFQWADDRGLLER